MKQSFKKIRTAFLAGAFIMLLPYYSYSQFTVDAGNSTSVCQGSGTTIGGSPTASGGAGSGYMYSWSPSSGLSSATSPNPVATPVTTTTYTITVLDSFAGSKTDSLTITVIPIPTISVNSATICAGQSATLNASGASTYTWNTGATTFSISVTPAFTTTYTVTGTTSGCSSTGTGTATVLPGASIMGFVNYTGGNVTSSPVVLFRNNPVTSNLDTVQTTTTDASGIFYFSSAAPDAYLIKVFPAASFTTLAPTYYGNSFLWDSATVLTHACTVNDTVFITALEMPPLSGSGIISGNISEGLGFSRVPGDPIPGVDVKLGRNPGGQLIAQTETNSSGNYSFSGLPVNNIGEYYTIFVDIPGLERDSTYNVTITSVNLTNSNLNYTADSGSVNPSSTIGIHKFETNENNLVISPNPASDNIMIDYSLGTSSETRIEIYNILGVKVASISDKNELAGKHKINFSLKDYNLKPGVYFITMEAEGSKSSKRLIIN